MTTLAYLNGRYVDRREALVPVDDRGFLFGDGIYEVTRAWNGALLEAEAHLRRLRCGIDALALDGVPDELPEISRALLRNNGLLTGHALVYWQITRGVATPRTHHYPPADTPLTIYASATTFVPPDAARATGVGTITVPDLRWARCDLKTVNLLPNVMARQKAVATGAWEAIMVRDGAVTEGAATNVFGVIDGILRTHPRSNYILHGVTREIVSELAAGIDLPLREDPLLVDEIPHLTECFLTGTTTDVMPVVTIDGHPVGDGRPGPIAGRLHAALIARWSMG
jgi:D-alanine transaminase